MPEKMPYRKINWDDLDKGWAETYEADHGPNKQPYNPAHRF